MKAILVALSLTPVLLAAKPTPKAEISAEVREDREELGKLRRELAAAILVKRLNPSREQRQELLRIIADAKALRATAVSGKEADGLREKRKQLLERAIEDARKTGEVSSQTKVAIEDLKGDAKDVRKEHKGKAKEIHERLRKVLTAEQIEELKELKSEMPGKRKQGKKGLGLRLLLSDEFAAELSR